MQVRSLPRHHLDDLVEVTIRRGPGYPVVTGQPVRRRAVAEPAQTENGLPETAQLPNTGPRASLAAFGQQQSSHVLGQCTGHIEGGTIGNHGEPLVLGLDLWSDQSYQGLFVSFPAHTPSTSD